MKRWGFSSAVIPAVAGILLALVITFISVGLTEKVSAEGDYCDPPPGCASLGCVTNGGQKSCVNYSVPGGSGSCGANSCKTYKPPGGDEPVGGGSL